MIELLRFILITIHVLAGAAWFGAMLYSLLALHPRALLFFQNSKQFEDFIAFLAAGARWKVLGIMALIAFSGMGLLFLPGAQQSVLFRNCVIIKIILFIFAFVVFCYASWILWPARIMAASHEIPMFQRRFRVVAIVLICLIGLSMVLGLTRGLAAAITHSSIIISTTNNFAKSGQLPGQH
jgi:hypothetical protein